MVFVWIRDEHLAQLSRPWPVWLHPEWSFLPERNRSLHLCYGIVEGLATNGNLPRCDWVSDAGGDCDGRTDFFNRCEQAANDMAWPDS